MEVATQAIDAFNGSDVDAFAALTTPDFEWSPSMVAIEGETFVEREGIETYFGRLDDAWERLDGVRLSRRGRSRASAAISTMPRRCGRPDWPSDLRRG